jgi:hypothetical protein
MMAATETPVAVRGDEHHRIGVRAGDSVADDIRGNLGEPPEAALLPRRDQRGDRVFICHRGPCGGERDPPPGAFTAPGDRPQRRCAAARTVGAEQEWERNPAAVAEIRTQAGAGHAAAREDQVENHIASKLERKDARVARGSVPKELLLLERVLGAPREPALIPHPVVGVEQLLAVSDIEPVAGKAVAVHRDAWIEPDDEPAWLIR